MSGILFFARDPGPANQVVAAYGLVTGTLRIPAVAGAKEFLADLRPYAGRLLVAGLGPALDVFRRAGIAAHAFDRMVALDGDSQNKMAACTRLLSQEAIAAVVTGTSDIDDDTDRILWSAARQLGIQTHAFLDHPANLGVRFRGAGDLTLLPDHLYAPDESYRPALMAAGISAERLRIVGPLHDTLLMNRRSAALAGREGLRCKWGAGPADRVVLFASECASEMAAIGRPSGYDEFAALHGLAARLAQGDGGPLGRGDPARYVLVVRPHPRDRAGKYDQALPGLAIGRALISGEGSPEEAILAADLIAGMRSSMMSEARVLDRPVFNLIEDMA